MSKTRLAALMISTALAAAHHADATGTIPTVGGYSTKLTVGIVTQVEGGSFVVRGTEWTADVLKVGAGLEAGDRIWVEAKSLVRLSDTSGGRITIAGPAVVEARKKDIWHVYRGSVKFKSSFAMALNFTHAIVSGKFLGEGAVWADSHEVQILSLAGDVKTWHPKLPTALVTIPPGFFAESSLESKHLQPGRIERVSEDHFKTFMVKFEKSTEDQVDPRVVAIRGLAAAKKPVTTDLVVSRGSRRQADVIEERSDDVMDHMKARIAGKDEEDIEEAALVATAGAPRDAYGRVIRPAHRGLARAVVEPQVEIVKQAPKPSHASAPEASHERFATKEELMRKLRKLGGRVEVKQ